MATIQVGAGLIDILVNNVWIIQDVTPKKMNKVTWDAAIRASLDSIFNMTKQPCEDMIAGGWGRSIHISSVKGSKGSVGQTNYVVAKAGTETEVEGVS